jgi:signal transduction histidine kinase
MAELLSIEHRILEKGYMDYRPFGIDLTGRKIRDVSGMTIRANVEYLEEVMECRDGIGMGAEAVIELCRCLNERLRDRAYHVTPAMLKNVWNSYSYEFTCFLGEFCERISRDPDFALHVGQNKFLRPLIQTLGRPFSIPQIYRMFPHFGEKFVKDSLKLWARDVTTRSAILGMRFTDSVYQQFGPYRKACARLACQSAKAGLASVPVHIHHQQPATMTDLRCIAQGDDCCEWELRWTPQSSRVSVAVGAGFLAGGLALAYLRMWHPEIHLLEALVFASFSATWFWLALKWRALQHQAMDRETLIQEQLRAVETRHEELREAYLQQEQTAVELRQKVNQLTTLHRTGLIFGATLDREHLLQRVLETLLHELHYDRAMIAVYDQRRQVSSDARISGVSREIADYARSIELHVTDPTTIEGTVLLQGQPVLVDDIRTAWDRMHAPNQQLAALVGTKCLVSVPLKIKDIVIGALTVDREQEQSLGQDDLDLMTTVASQVAIALDNAEAYRQIEALNAGLEDKVRERTVELERLNELKSLFLSHVSHELRTPLTAIRGFVENMLSGLLGPLDTRQEGYLTRVKVNSDRLVRMIADLMDRTRIETGKIELSLAEVSLCKLANDVIEQLVPLTAAKSLRIELRCVDTDLVVMGDWDKLSQVLINLLDNAVKYTPDHGDIIVQIEKDDAQMARVRVRDSGCGIPASYLPKLFDPFFQVAGQKTYAKGLGLGLSIVKNLVEAHKGQVQVHSEEGHGAEFAFTVPLHGARPRLPTTPLGSGRRLLIVDDDPDIRLMLYDRLTGDGYGVETVSEGLEALEKLRDGFDGVLLDINLPGIDGLEVLRRIRHMDAVLPVIMVTASENKQRAEQALTMGAQAYLLKPFEAGRMKDIVDQWFRPTP